MQKLPVPERPQYPVGSVDKALRLIHMLRDHGEIRLRSAAEELGVAESTVHRLMAMLVFHGFAMKSEARGYVPGYALGAGPVRSTWTRSLREVVPEHAAALSRQTGETVNVEVRVGTKLRFLHSHEGTSVLRIVDRTGVVIPAVKAAGGRVMLADLPEETVRRLFQGQIAQAQGEAMTDSELELLLRELSLHRRNGFATANQETELGVCAIAMPIRDIHKHVIAALAIAAPSVRYDSLVTRETMRALASTRDAIEHDLYSLSD